MEQSNFYKAPDAEVMCFSFEENVATSPTTSSEGIDDVTGWSEWE
jgi:hypothetical protein